MKLDKLSSKTYDREILEVISKLFDKKSPIEILEILYFLRKDKRFLLAKARVEAGENIFNALAAERLITDELYDYLISASSNRKLSEFTRAYLTSMKETRRIVSDLIKQMASPLLALAVHYIVLYVAIYKLVKGIDMDEKWFRALPGYFRFLDYIADNPQIFMIYVVTTLGIAFIVFLLRKRLIPSYSFYEKMKLYLYLYYSVKSGKKVEEALANFKTSFDNQKFVSLLESGEELSTAMIESMKIKPKILEQVLIRSAFEGKESEIEKNVEDLYTQLLDLTRNSIAKTGMVLNIFFMLVVAGLILFVYLGINLPIAQAARVVAQ